MKRPVHIEGHSKPLFVFSLSSSCGDIHDGAGVSFAFQDEGCWIIPLEELRAIVAEADAYAATRCTEVCAHGHRCLRQQDEHEHDFDCDDASHFEANDA